MGSNSKGIEEKGSKHWMQQMINSGRKDDLNKMLGADIEWLSPLALQDNYAEYQLNQDYICDKLNITNKKIFDFWPQNQPHWDAIGINRESECLYLVEAKSHLDEMNSSISATSEKSIAQIKQSMREVFDQYNAPGNFDIWQQKYYQMANRLTFLKKLNELQEQTGWSVTLVLLQFVNDNTYKPTSLKEWQDHYRKVWNKMIGQETQPDGVSVLYYDVSEEE